MTNPSTWSTIMHFEDLADNGELSVKSSLQDHYRPANNIKLDYDYITSKPPPLPPPPPPLPWFLNFFLKKKKRLALAPRCILLNYKNKEKLQENYNFRFKMTSTGFRPTTIINQQNRYILSGFHLMMFFDKLRHRFEIVEGTPRIWYKVIICKPVNWVMTTGTL